MLSKGVKFNLDPRKAFQHISINIKKHGINNNETAAVLTSILLFTLKNPSASATTVGFEAPTAMIAPWLSVQNFSKLAS